MCTFEIVTARRLGQGGVGIPAGNAIKLAGRMTVRGQQGGILLTNTPPSGDPRSRRIFIQQVSGGASGASAGAGPTATPPCPS